MPNSPRPRSPSAATITATGSTAPNSARNSVSPRKPACKQSRNIPAAMLSWHSPCARSVSCASPSCC
eukprot:1090197-Prymnesium_polylepis.1